MRCVLRGCSCTKYKRGVEKTRANKGTVQPAAITLVIEWLPLPHRACTALWRPSYNRQAGNHETSTTWNTLKTSRMARICVGNTALLQHRNWPVFLYKRLPSEYASFCSGYAVQARQCASSILRRSLFGRVQLRLLQASFGILLFA